MIFAFIAVALVCFALGFRLGCLKTFHNAIKMIDALDARKR